MLENGAAYFDKDDVRSRENGAEEKGVEADREFDVGVNSDRVSNAVGSSAKNAVAKGQTAHEDGQNDRLSVDGAAEHLAEVFGPDDLVNQRRSAGTEE